MPLKKGQKLTENPKDVRYELRLTRQEADDLNFCADKLGICRSELINRGVRLLKEEIEMKKG